MVNSGVVQRASYRRTELTRHQHEARFARLVKIVVNETVIAAAGLQQR
jgi:hypothetical protein